DIFICRHPIYNSHLGVYAFDLFFRSSKSAIENDDEKMAAELARAAFFDVSISRFTESRPTAIWLSEYILRKFIAVKALPVEPEKLILTIPPNMQPDERTFMVLKHLARQGVRLALEDFLSRKQSDPLFPISHLVKFDPDKVNEKKLKALIEKFKKDATLLVAKNVKTIEDYKRLRALGVNCFQGEAFGSPRVFRAKILPAGENGKDVSVKMQYP
ncbi:MAG: EAL domain-containing protein, partial [Gammaproteobacteria bacterium]|nr:EAL domain-containing protein [Gammaproteobacteria bacterium]